MPKRLKYLCVLLIDNSYSMSSELESVNRGLQSFLQRLRDSDLPKDFSVGLIVFNDTAKVFLPPSKVDSIAKFPIIETDGSGTNIYSGYSKAMSFISQWKNHDFFNFISGRLCKPYIILVTDLSKDLLKASNKKHRWINEIKGKAKRGELNLHVFGAGEALYFYLHT